MYKVVIWLDRYVSLTLHVFFYMICIIISLLLVKWTDYPRMCQQITWYYVSENYVINIWHQANFTVGVFTFHGLVALFQILIIWSLWRSSCDTWKVVLFLFCFVSFLPSLRPGMGLQQQVFSVKLESLVKNFPWIWALDHHRFAQCFN